MLELPCHAAGAHLLFARAAAAAMDSWRKPKTKTTARVAAYDPTESAFHLQWLLRALRAVQVRVGAKELPFEQHIDRAVLCPATS